METTIDAQNLDNARAILALLIIIQGKCSCVLNTTLPLILPPLYLLSSLLFTVSCLSQVLSSIDFFSFLGVRLRYLPPYFLPLSPLAILSHSLLSSCISFTFHSHFIKSGGTAVITLDRGRLFFLSGVRLRYGNHVRPRSLLSFSPLLLLSPSPLLPLPP